MRASRAWLLPAAIAVAVAAGCSNTVVNTGEKAEQTEAAPPTTPTRPSNDKLVNAFDFFADTPIGDGGYYFASPSGAWHCVIVARMWAGCQSAGGSLGIAGAPASVTDDRGRAATPNAISSTGSSTKTLAPRCGRKARTWSRTKRSIRSR